MATWKKILITVSTIIIVLIVFGFVLMRQFLSAFAPPKIEITKECISTNRNFINGLIIEQIKIDSMSQNGIPIRYTVNYWTSCNIDHPEGRSPKPPNKICFNKNGKYWWTEEKVNIQFIHKGLRRESLENNNRIHWSVGSERLPTCPLEFQKEQWYFIRFRDPKVTGIFFHIDNEGVEHQHYLVSGVSPI